MLTHNYWKPRKSVHLPLGANKRLMGITNLRVGTNKSTATTSEVTDLQEANSSPDLNQQGYLDKQLT
jgi:hypothetical protein